MKIIHLSSVDPNPNSGMGRVSYYWQQALTAEGYQFLHIGLKEIAANRKIHPLWQGWYFRQYLLKNNIQADIIMAHEPLCGWLPLKKTPLISFSHGIEERAWLIQQQFGILKKGRWGAVLPIQLRFYSNNLGFKKAAKILVLNKADYQYLIEEKKVHAHKIALIKNGYTPMFIGENMVLPNKIVFLFNGSWIPRKGNQLLVAVFNEILAAFPQAVLRIAGTGLKPEVLKAFFEQKVFNQIEVISNFDADSEKNIYQGAAFFVLPSYLEGQSLALNQAMAMGLCPIVSNNSGQIDMIQHKVNGLVFETGDVASLKSTIIWAIHHFEEALQLGKMAQQSIAPYTWENAANKIVAICKSIN
ncbi:glycosyltransferase family 4 protein [Hydrotalea sp.]|uniref:glycosyltransferase family 4 protein n=1 Tax=Hydrotalea sp. TaxID=2881279 RepID=UPI003D1521F9